jgi:hypothetical protein
VLKMGLGHAHLVMDGYENISKKKKFLNNEKI